MVGIDVFHERNKTSVAAIVSLFGNNLENNLNYVSNVKKSQEIIPQFSDVVMDHLEQAQKKMNGKIKKIVVYRDGVGEGMENYVKDQELAPLLDKIDNKYGENTIQVSEMIVTKRIDDRFAVLNNGRLSNSYGGLII